MLPVPAPLIITILTTDAFASMPQNYNETGILNSEYKKNSTLLNFCVHKTSKKFWKPKVRSTFAFLLESVPILSNTDNKNYSCSALSDFSYENIRVKFLKRLIQI